MHAYIQTYIHTHIHQAKNVYVHPFTIGVIKLKHIFIMYSMHINN